jgi:hypothetical protein
MNRSESLPSQSTEKTVVVARFANRRDAEMAKNRLAETDVQALITADDAGGVHIDLQHVHGVRLAVLQSRASDAIAALVDAGWTDEVVIDPGDAFEDDGRDATGTLILWITAGLCLAAALATALAYALGAMG